MVVEIRDNVRSLAGRSGGLDSSAIDQIKSEMNDKIAQVEEERNGWARYATNKDDELNATKGELAESEKLRLEMAQKVDDMKTERERYTERKEMELKEARDELAARNVELEGIQLEMVQKAEAKQRESEEAREKQAALDDKLNELNRLEKVRLELVEKLEAKDTELKQARNELAEKVAAKEDELSKAKEASAEFEDQRNAWANYATSKANELDSTVEKLLANKIELDNWTRYANSKNSELKEAQHGLEATKINHLKLDEEFRSYKKHVECMIPELRSRITELEGNDKSNDGTVPAMCATLENNENDTAEHLKEAKKCDTRSRRSRIGARQ